MTERACPFCTPDADRVFYQGERVFALWDAFPVSDGHALIITKRHVATWFDASRATSRPSLAYSVPLPSLAKPSHPNTFTDGFNIRSTLEKPQDRRCRTFTFILIPR